MNNTLSPINDTSSKAFDELKNEFKEWKNALTSQLNEEIDKIKDERNEVRLQIIKNMDKLQDAFIRQNSARINCQNAKEKMGSSLSDFDALREEAADILFNQIYTFVKTLKENISP